jgi:hypothetical protein
VPLGTETAAAAPRRASALGPADGRRDHPTPGPHARHRAVVPWLRVSAVGAGHGASAEACRNEMIGWPLRLTDGVRLGTVPGRTVKFSEARYWLGNALYTETGEA